MPRSAESQGPSLPLAHPIATESASVSRRTLTAENKPPATLDTDLRTVRLFVQFLEACRGRAFEARRDLAILLLLIDTGMRRGEVASVQCHDLDLD